MSLATVLTLAAIYGAVAGVIINRNRRLRSRANKAEGHKLLMAQLLYAIAKSKESQTIWIPKPDLPPADSTAGVHIIKSAGGITIRTMTRPEDS